MKYDCNAVIAYPSKQNRFDSCLDILTDEFRRKLNKKR